MEDDQTFRWRKLNVKQEHERRLKPSNIANPQHYSNKQATNSKRSTRVSPNAQVTNRQPSYLRNKLHLRKSVEATSVPFNGHQKKVSDSLNETHLTSTSGWMNPDLTNFKRPLPAIYNLEGSGSIELETSQHGTFGLYQNSVASTEKQCNCDDVGGLNLVPNSIQIEIQDKKDPSIQSQATVAQVLRRISKQSVQDASSSQAKEAGSENRLITPDRKQSTRLRDTLHGDFFNSDQNGPNDGRQVHHLGEADEKEEVDLMQLAERYLTSNKEQAKKQMAYEQQILLQHRDNQVSRMSSSAIGEDHVLVGGRITAGGKSNKVIPTSSQIKSKPLTSCAPTVGEHRGEADGGYSTMVASDQASGAQAQEAKTNRAPQTADEKQPQANLRQIIVQKKKDTNQKVHETMSKQRKGTLIKSILDRQRYSKTGFIYSDQADNLTISKDILYDDQQPEVKPKIIQSDSNKFLALKELLNNQQLLNEKQRYNVQKSSYQTQYNFGQGSYRGSGFDKNRYGNSTKPDASYLDKQDSSWLQKAKSRAYQSVRHSMGHQKRNTAANSVGQEEMSMSQHYQRESQSHHRAGNIPPIALQNDHQKMMKFQMNQRLTTARNLGPLPLQEPSTVYGGGMKGNGAQNNFIHTNRHIRTNQQVNRGGQAAAYTASSSPAPAADFISLQEDCNRSQFIKTQAGEETVSTAHAPSATPFTDLRKASTLVNKDQLQYDSKKASVVIEDSRDSMTQTATMPEDALTMNSDVAFVPALSLEIVHKYNDGLLTHHYTNQGVAVTQMKNSNVSKHSKAMASVYQGIMPSSTGSNMQMGIQLSNRLPAKKVTNQIDVHHASIGRSYMSSFTGRKARQSPRKLKDAQKAFIEKKVVRNQPPQRSVQNNIESPPMHRSPVKNQTMDDRTQRSFDSRQVKQKAYKTMAHISNVTSGSVSLTAKARTTNTTKTQRKEPQVQGSVSTIVSVTDRQSSNNFDRISMPIASQLLYDNAASQSLKKSSSKMSNGQVSSRGGASRSQIQKTDTFLLETRAEKQRMSAEEMLIEESLNHDHKKLMLNQPSQELSSDIKRVTKADLNQLQWRQVPLQHRDSSNWPLDNLSKNSQKADRLRLTNIVKYDSPTKNYRGNEMKPQQTTTSIQEAQRRASSQLRSHSSESIQWQSTSPGCNLKSQKRAQQKVQTHTQSQFNQAHARMTLYSEAFPVRTSPNNALYSIKAQAHHPGFKPKNPGNRRVAGGSQTNKVGAIRKGKGLTARQTNHQTLERDKSRQKESGMISRTNSQLQVGASKAKIESRWNEFSQKQKSHFEEAKQILAVNTLRLRSDGNDEECPSSSEFDKKDWKKLDQTASRGSLSPPVTGVSRSTLKGTRPMTLNQAKALAESITKSPESAREMHGIELIIKKAPNLAPVKTMKPFDGSLVMTRDVTEPGLSDVKFDTEILSPNFETYAQTIQESARGQKNQTSIEPGTALLIDPERLSALEDHNIENQPISGRIKDQAGSRLKRHNPRKKDTLMLSDQVISEYNKLKLQQPQVAEVSIHGKGQNTVSPGFVSPPTGHSHSPMQKNIIIGGSQIQSNRQITTHFTPDRNQSPMNSDLYSVMNQKKNK